MTEVKGVGIRKTQFLDDLTKQEILGAKGGRQRSKMMETTVFQSNIKKYKLIFRKSMVLLICSILNNNNNQGPDFHDLKIP
jgi:hypothetical protein